MWCGDNEANPQPPLEGWMRENVKTFDGGDRYFQANSHAQGLTGSGPWGALNPKDYFMKYPDGLEGDPARGWGFRTEIGTAVVPAFESLKNLCQSNIGGQLIKCGICITLVHLHLMQLLIDINRQSQKNLENLLA